MIQIKIGFVFRPFFQALAMAVETIHCFKNSSKCNKNIKIKIKIDELHSGHVYNIIIYIWLFQTLNWNFEFNSEFRCSTIYRADGKKSPVNFYTRFTRCVTSITC